MKKSIKLILIQVIFLILASRAFSEPYDDLFLYASKLDQAGAYEEAELEYKRYIFMLNYSQGQYEAQAFCALADLYEKKENYHSINSGIAIISICCIISYKENKKE